MFSAAIAQLGERQTEDLKVPGSIPGGGYFFFLLFVTKQIHNFGPLCVLSNSSKSSIILVGVVGNISACHADARGSIPRLGVFFLVYLKNEKNCSWRGSNPRPSAHKTNALPLSYRSA